MTSNLQKSRKMGSQAVWTAFETLDTDIEEGQAHWMKYRTRCCKEKRKKNKKRDARKGRKGKL